MSAETQKVDVLENIKGAIKRTSPTTHFNERANLWATHDAVDELIEAAKDEARRSSITSLPLKIELARELGISLDEVDAWMLHAHRRFIAALARVGGVS